MVGFGLDVFMQIVGKGTACLFHPVGSNPLEQRTIARRLAPEYPGLRAVIVVCRQCMDGDFHAPISA